MYTDDSLAKSSKYPALFPYINEGIKKLDPANRKPIVVKDLAPSLSTKKTCFLLENVLTPEECKVLIETSEKQGFEKAEDYCYLYRDRLNDRIMSDDVPFSNFLWERVAPHIPPDHKGWKVKGLNPRWRYCKYNPGHYFGSHTDGRYTPNSHETSHLTFMLYLNGHDDKDLGGFEGGCTRFIKRDGTLKLALPPKTGSALVFLQEDMDLFHDGEKLESGKKYILRSDIMFTIEK